MYFLLGLSLIFALLLASNLTASISATLLWHILSKRRAEKWSARRRADFIYAIRVFPFLAAIAYIIFFMVPAYLLFEPYSSGETVGSSLGLISGISALGVLIAMYRLCTKLRATYMLTQNWLRQAERIKISDVSIPVFRIKHSFPVIAVVGAFRPKMFIASQIFDALTDEELEAVMLHENGHVYALDNLKRIIMRIWMDLLVFPFGRSLERAWVINAETAADEYAARIGGNRMAVSLAAALVKIARLVPEGSKPSMPAGAFLVGTQTADITFRIQKLLQFTEIQIAPAKQLGNKVLLWLSFGLILEVVLFLSFDRNFLFKVHCLTEIIVTSFQ